jgi:tetratricopeptide (TPR) repeat protein
VFDRRAAGGLYARGGRLPRATWRRRRLLEAAIEASPTLAQAHAGLGLVRETLGQKDAAIIAYQKALELKPDDFLAGGGLARLTGASSGAELPANHPTAGSGEDSEEGVTP